MSYVTDLGANPTIIDDSNADFFRAQIMDSSTPFMGGYRERDYVNFKLGHYAPTYRGKIYPRSQWDDLIKQQDDNHSSPWHTHTTQKVPVLNQSNWGYCWCFGTVAGVMNRYAAQGLTPTPHLSAMGPALQGKRGRNEGGWAGEAIRYIGEYGIPTVQTWPETAANLSLAREPAVVADAARHGLVEFEELRSQQFDAAMSCLLDPRDPCPVTLGLMWWGHLVCGLRAVKIDRNTYGIVIVNSWTARWGDNGYGVLVESKATAHEQVAIRRVTPRANS